MFRQYEAIHDARENGRFTVDPSLHGYSRIERDDIAIVLGDEGTSTRRIVAVAPIPLVTRACVDAERTRRNRIPSGASRRVIALFHLADRVTVHDQSSSPSPVRNCRAKKRW